MQIQLSLLALALPAPAGTALAPVPQGIGPGASTPAADKPEDKAFFGEPLFVNGRRVSYDELKLQLIYGPCRAVLDLSKLGMVIEDEITRQAEEKAEAEVAA